MDSAVLVSLLALTWTVTGGMGQTAIAQGACRTYRYRNYRKATCSVPDTTPDMTIRVTAVRDLGPGECVQGTNFRLSVDNAQLLVDYPCSAVFLVEALNDTAAPASSSTTTTTTTQAPVVTWGVWSSFSECSVSCGGGLMSRTRECSTGDERDCLTIFSYAVDTRACNTDECAVVTAPPTPASTASCGVAGSYRVVGGTAAGACEFPWMVLVYDAAQGTVCGGSIIDEWTVLTAAHCVFREDRRGRTVQAPARDMQVLSGSSVMPFSGVDVPGLVRRAVVAVWPHEDYDGDTLEHDIAVLKLSSPVTFDPCHAPVCLTDGRTTPQSQQDCLTMGWGVDSNRASASVQENLYFADVPITDDLTCQAVYGRSSNNGTFCAGGEGSDACQGDSGGPLVCRSEGRYVQHGVVSAGIESRCGSVPGLYTRVSSYLTWLSARLGVTSRR